MTDDMRPIRIGRINYTNVWPIFYQFPSEALKARVELIEQVPTELNAAMQSGEVDMGAMSSFAYGEQSDDLYLLPELSVSTFGSVRSILLFHREPISSLDGKRIALTTASATSVNLLKMILGKFYEIQPDYWPSKPDLPRMMEQADAALLIGDDAIRARWQYPQYRVMDLGEQWKKFTGYGMTYAVWAVRRDTATRLPSVTTEVVDELQRSKRLGTALPKPLLDRARREIGGTEAFWREYFSGLRYSLGDAEKQGLSLYFRLARDMGLLNKQVDLVEWPAAPQSWMTQVNE